MEYTVRIYCTTRSRCWSDCCGCVVDLLFSGFTYFVCFVGLSGGSELLSREMRLYAIELKAINEY